MQFFNIFKPTNLTLAEAMRGRVIIILVLVATIQTLYPITAYAPHITLIPFQMLYVLMIIAGVLIAREAPGMVRLMVFFGIGWAITGPFYALDPDNVIVQIAAYAFIGIYQLLVALVLLRFVFITERVDLDVIYAACAVYLLLGAAFVGVYGVVDVLTVETMGQHALSDAQANPDEIFPWQYIVYYSYSTLTTLGYGDVLPVTMVARAISSMQAIIGVLYLTVIVARLVGLYAAQETEDAIAESSSG